MDQFLTLIPGLSLQEINILKQLTGDLSEQEKQTFLSIYQNRRKDKQTMMLLTILGFFLIAGLQRFVVGHIAMGVVYLLTGGLCLIGTIVDLINIDKLTDEYNQKVALESKQLLLALRSNSSTFV